MEGDKQREHEATVTTIKSEISMRADGLMGASQTYDKMMMEKSDMMAITNRVKVGIILHLMYRIDSEEITIDITATSTQLNTIMHLTVGAKAVGAVCIHVGSQIIPATIISKETNTTAIPPTISGALMLLTNSTTAITATTKMV